MDNNGTAPTHGTTGGTRWQGRIALLLLTAVVLYYVSMAGLNFAGFFDYRELAVSDTSFFRHFGRRMTEGATLYTDLWDTKGPMVYLTYYWGYLLSSGATWGLDVAVLVYSLVATLCAYRALRCLGGPLPAALGVVLLSQTTGFIGWCGTSTESTYALWVVIALAVLLPAGGEGGRYGWRWLLAGAVVALCVLSKTNYVGFGCFLLAWWVVRGCFWRAAAMSAAGFAAVLGVAVLALWCNGNLDAMVDSTVLFNLHEYHAAPPAWADFSSLPGPVAGVLTLAASEFQYAKHFLNAYTCMALLMLISAAVLWMHRKEGTPRAVPYTALVVWVAAEFLTGGVKFLIYDHYYTTLFLPVCMLAVAAAGALQSTWKKAGLLALMVAATAVSSGPWGQFRLIGDDVQQRMEKLSGMAENANPQHMPVAVLGGTYVLHATNTLHLHSDQRYLHNAWMLDYDLSPARRQELLDELATALEQAPLLLSEEPLPSLISRHPELAPLLRGWRAVDESPQNRVFLYLPPEKQD